MESQLINFMCFITNQNIPEFAFCTLPIRFKKLKTPNAKLRQTICSRYLSNSIGIIYYTRDWQAYIDELVQERRNSIANALDLRLSCIIPPICCWKFGDIFDVIWIKGNILSGNLMIDQREMRLWY